MITQQWDTTDPVATRERSCFTLEASSKTNFLISFLHCELDDCRTQPLSLEAIRKRSPWMHMASWVSVSPQKGILSEPADCEH